MTIFPQDISYSLKHKKLNEYYNYVTYSRSSIKITSQIVDRIQIDEDNNIIDSIIETLEVF